MTFPVADNIPEINFNIEGLRRHSLLCVFVEEKGISEKERKFRGWLLHSVFAAVRHYSKARDLVVLQNNTDQQRDGGLILHWSQIAS